MDKNIQQPPIPETLTQNQALGLLIQGVNFAQSKGVFALNDAALLHKAVSMFTGPEIATPDATPNSVQKAEVASEGPETVSTPES